MVFKNGDRLYMKRMNIATSHVDSWLVHNQNIPQFQVFIVMYSKIIVFWDIMSCGLVNEYQFFFFEGGEDCYIQLQVKTMQQEPYKVCQ